MIELPDFGRDYIVVRDGRPGLTRQKDVRIYCVIGVLELVKLVDCDCEYCPGHEDAKEIGVREVVEAESEEQAADIALVMNLPPGGDYELSDSGWSVESIQDRGPVGSDVLAKRMRHPMLFELEGSVK